MCNKSANLVSFAFNSVVKRYRLPCLAHGNRLSYLHLTNDPIPFAAELSTSAVPTTRARAAPNKWQHLNVTLCLAQPHTR